MKSRFFSLACPSRPLSVYLPTGGVLSQSVKLNDVKPDVPGQPIFYV